MTDSDTRLDQALRGLNPERAPDRDLWPDIADRLDAAPARRTRSPWRYALAASLVGAIAAGVVLAPPAPDTAPVLVAAAPDTGADTAEEPWAPMLASFRQAEQTIRASTRAAEPDQASAPASEAAPLAGSQELEMAIQKLEQQSAQLREALKADPNDIDTIQTLARVERRRLELIRLVAQLDQAPAGGLSHADITF